MLRKVSKMSPNRISTRLARVPLSLFAALLLASCGGGDPYAGQWLGSLSPGRQASGVVLDDGSYYVIYSRQGAPSVIGGVLQGSGDFHGSRFTSTDGRDFNMEGVRATQAAIVSGKISPRRSVEGSVNGATAFKLSHVRDSDGEADLAALAGSYGGDVLLADGVARPATFVVTPAGQVSTSINGCPITGQVTPRGDADAYDLTVAFGAYPCVFPYAQFAGVAYLREDTRRLEAIVVHGTRTQAIAFTGARQQ